MDGVDELCATVPTFADESPATFPLPRRGFWACNARSCCASLRMRASRTRLLTTHRTTRATSTFQGTSVEPDGRTRGAAPLVWDRTSLPRRDSGQRTPVTS